MDNLHHSLCVNDVRKSCVNIKGNHQSSISSKICHALSRLKTFTRSSRRLDKDGFSQTRRTILSSAPQDLTWLDLDYISKVSFLDLPSELKIIIFLATLTGWSRDKNVDTPKLFMIMLGSFPRLGIFSLFLKKRKDDNLNRSTFYGSVTGLETDVFTLPDIGS